MFWGMCQIGFSLVVLKPTLKEVFTSDNLFSSYKGLEPTSDEEKKVASEIPQSLLNNNRQSKELKRLYHQ